MNLSTFQYIFSSIFNIHQKKGGETTEMKLLLVISQYCYKCLRVVGFLIYFSTSPRHFEQYFLTYIRKRHRERNEVTVSDISNSVDFFLQLKNIDFEDTMSSTF